MNIRPSLPSSRMGQQGNAMLLVLLLTTTALGLTTVAYRSTDDAIRVENFQSDRDFRDLVITNALAEGVQLLRTGAPPLDPFRFVITTKLTDGSTYYTQVEIVKNPKAKSGSAEPYVVTAKPGTLADSLKYGPPPKKFKQGEGDGEGDDDGDDDDDHDEQEKSNNGVGWGVGGVPPGAGQGKKDGKD